MNQQNNEESGQTNVKNWSIVKESG